LKAARPVSSIRAQPEASTDLEETARAEPATRASTCEWRQQNTDTGDDWAFQYDALGNLLSVGLPNGDLVEYLVDGMGRRVGRKKNGVLLKQWIYRDALKPVAELNGAGALVAEFVYGSKSNVPDYVRRGAATYRVISDQLGSPRYVVNVANASDIPFRADYSSFGEVTGTGLDWMPFGFAGGIYDSDAGLVMFGKRDYSANTGRWNTKEPLRFSGSRNFYVYSLSDPLNSLDPNGMSPFQSEQAFYQWIRDKLDRLGSYPQAVDIFEGNYDKMIEVNTAYADKYYHCMANCEAAAIGRADVAEAISDAREWVDRNIKWDSEGASACDQQANHIGRDSGSDDWLECTAACAILRPISLDQTGRY